MCHIDMTTQKILALSSKHCSSIILSDLIIPFHAQTNILYWKTFPILDLPFQYSTEGLEGANSSPHTLLYVQQCRRGWPPPSPRLPLDMKYTQSRLRLILPTVSEMLRYHFSYCDISMSMSVLYTCVSFCDIYESIFVSLKQHQGRVFFSSPFHSLTYFVLLQVCLLSLISILNVECKLIHNPSTHSLTLCCFSELGLAQQECPWLLVQFHKIKSRWGNANNYSHILGLHML